MFFAKIICTLLLIQSFQSTFAQYYDDLGPNESLPRFEARRTPSLYAKEDFEYDNDDSAASRGKTNTLPARSGRNDNNNEDDFDENQAPQSENAGSSSSGIVGPSGIKGQAVSGSGKLGLPRFPSKPAPPRPVVISTPVTPVTVVGKTNIGSSGSLSGDRSFFPLRSNDATKTVRVVKTARVVRPVQVAVDQSEASLGNSNGGVKTTFVRPTVTRIVRPVQVAVDQSEASSANLNEGVKTIQVRPTVTRVVRPVVVQQRQTLVTPVQPVAPAPLPVSIATPITSGSSGPNQIVSGGVKTVQVSGNPKIQPPRLRVQRPVAPVVVDDDDDEDDSASASSGPSQGQVSGVKTTATNQFSSEIHIPPGKAIKFIPSRPQPIRQQAQVIYADQKLTSKTDYDFEDNFNIEIPQPDIFKINRPASVPVRVAPQPYLVPLPSRPFSPESSADISPAVSSNGKVNVIKSTFISRPQPVPVRQTVLTPVAPSPIRPNPTPIFINSGSASGSQSAVKGSVSVASRFIPRIPTTQRPATTVSFVDEDEDDSASGVRNPSGARPVLIQTTGPAPVRPVVQTNVQEKINTGSQSVASVRPVLRFNPQPQPQLQQIVQIRDSGALPAEISLPSPPRPVQIVQRVRNTPAPTIRPVTQVTQVRESAVSNFQTVQTSQPRLVPVAPAPQPQIRVFEQARPLTQVSQVSQFEDAGLTVFQPLDPSLRPSIPQPTVQVSQVREAVAPREVVIRQPAQPQVQVSQVSQVSQVRQVQPSVETVQIRETAVPITSQGNLGVQQISQPRPVEVIQPAPQPIEILRLREPSFPRFSFEQARPQPVVSVRPRLVPVALPERRQVVQISQEKEVSLAQPVVPAQVNIIQQQKQFQQQQQEIINEERQSRWSVAPVAPLVNIESFKTVSQPRPVLRQPVVPRLVVSRPVTSDSQSSGFSGNVQSRFETVQIPQPTPVITVQQQRPTIVVNRPQPAQVIVSNRQPVTTVQVQDNSQSAEQIVQIRDNAASIPDDFAQIQQVKLARA